MAGDGIQAVDVLQKERGGRLSEIRNGALNAPLPTRSASRRLMTVHHRVARGGEVRNVRKRKPR